MDYYTKEYIADTLWSVINLAVGSFFLGIVAGLFAHFVLFPMI